MDFRCDSMQCPFLLCVLCARQNLPPQVDGQTFIPSFVLCMDCHQMRPFSRIALLYRIFFQLGFACSFFHTLSDALSHNYLVRRQNSRDALLDLFAILMMVVVHWTPLRGRRLMTL
ncbi:hypothetical protein EJ05DRAFT_42067 [Pseudovirgaria hyperparasitica]|uniref:Uncharacterized protein n=1 Tax=Pseudovirgaria hyperparasitica TaxID=470096 RepID=A0A6A6WNC4_9PEZI|nr:uncharacterized protein EJ05DRAFT_42067 [Pseudovirgaria hyperparasitica]KAF2763522.1 hypothetical protein EJ05DRAFT_42067 [Pseudovirgaria hyperparasitica]